MRNSDLPIIQKTYDLIRWYVPILNRLPKNHRFNLGDRIIDRLYGLLEKLIEVRYQKDKLSQLRKLNTELDVLRYQTRLLLDFELISIDRYDYIGQQIQSVGQDLGGWIDQQRNKK